MASSSARIRSALKRGLRNPVRFARNVWSRKVEVVFILTGAVPGRVRRPLARPAARFAEWAVARRPGLRVAPQLAFIARWAAGPPEEAAELARRLGTSPRSTRRSRRELAQMAHARGFPEAAAAIVATLPDDRTPAIEMLRANFALQAGRYEEARTAARRQASTGRERARILLERTESRLAVLQPDWWPDLGPGEARLAAPREPVVRGRILHILSNSLPYRQAGYTLRAQAVGLAQRAVGLDPHFATRAGFPRSEGIEHAPRDQQVDGVPYHRLAPDFADLSYQDRLVDATARAAIPLIERLRPAALQPTSNHLQAQVALALARPLGIPVVYEVRGFLEETWASSPGIDEREALQSDRYRLTRETETRAMVAADAVVTLSETMRQAIIARGALPDNVIVVPNAVDVERFRPIPRDDALAASLGIEPGDAVIGYISSLTAYEGIAYLLEAAARIRRPERPLRVVVVGDGKEHDALVEAGRRLGLDDGTLIMPGRVPHEDVIRYHSIIDVFVVPRTGDRVSRLVTPLKPYEAMAMERALVVSDVPALREIVTPGETGLTFQAENAEDLAAVLNGLLDDPALRARLGRQAREWVVESRTWAQNGRRYRALYERLGVA